MRRSEFNVEDKEQIEKILFECEYGTLSLISEGKPYGVAVNFVWHKNKIFIHGAKEGRKVQAIAHNSKASFLVVKAYSLIPSYFSHALVACPATQFFASVHFEGTIKQMHTPEAKVIVLNKLMEKLQSEGGYETIDANSPMYTKMVENTAVFELTPSVISCKIKAGQNLSREKREEIAQQLMQRESNNDKETAALMQIQS
ncbi:MAG: pyridoxamine 5'-phosphate oxidase family protein [Candidatus Marinarcus sp.]|uniref:pyridoxamine 5'-phosphate oxidase family protein n=1 Tax=Candidatus Marinarcus sp. TaxID=3100987 RepID=UPI003B0084B4